MEEQDAGTKRIGVACKACGVAISWECNYCPECGATEMFQPRVKKMPLPGGGVPTRVQAQRDYQRNQSKHVQKKNRRIVGEDMLAAAFAAGQHGTGHDNDENASPAVTQHGEKRKRRKRGKDAAAASAAARQAARHGTIVKPHTFASYGVSTAKSKTRKQQKQQSMSSSQQQHRQAPAGNLGRAKRRGKRRSAYDASLARLLEKEPELERKTTVLDGPGASNSSSSGGTAQDTVTNKNAHLTDVLTTLCKIERAEGNLLPAASYERAALSLSTHPTSVHSAKDLLGVRNVDNTAAAKVEEILEAETRRQLGGGRDVMEHASDLIAAFSRQSFANKSQDRAAQAARLRLTAMLEEEQVRATQ